MRSSSMPFVRVVSQALLLLGVAALVFLGSATVRAGALDVWTYRTNGLPARPISSVAYGAGRFVMQTLYPPMAFYTSENGADWTERFTLPGNPYNGSVRFLHDRFVSVDDFGNCLTSSNGLDWLTATNMSAELRGATYGNGRWVIFSRNARKSWATTNFVDWTHGTVTVSNQFSLHDIVFANGRFVITSTGSFVSTNGVDWTHYAGPFLGQAAVGDGKIVAFSFGSAATSYDGVTWALHPLNAAGAYVANVTYGNGTFIAVGSSNQSHHTILLSTDGTNWSPKLIGPRRPNNFLSDAAYGAGTFVVSADGAGAGSSTIAQSGNVAVPQLNRMQLVSGGRVGLQIDGEVGRAYRLEVSTNLLNWDFVTDYTNDLPRTQVTTPPIVSGEMQFFRALIP